MTSRFQLLPLPSALALLMVVGAAAAKAVEVGPYRAPCPRLNPPAGSGFFQPSRLQPSEVQGKNALGCLSPADAIYGPDGCPARFCGSEAGVLQLPGANQAPVP